jgi:hypothetical protein
MDRGYNLSYQLAVAPSSKMMNDFATVVSPPPDKVIEAS